MSTREHKKKAPKRVKEGIRMVSKNRKIAESKRDIWIRKTDQKEGNKDV